MTDDVAVSTEIQVDDETRAALLLFNERVEAAAAQERGAKRVAKAERAKDEAAAVVRKVGENPNASAEEKAEAEAAYKVAVASFNTIKDDPLAGEQARKPKAKEAASVDVSEGAKEAEASQDAPAEPAETSADEEGADAAPAVTSTEADDPAPAEEAAPVAADDSEE